MYMKDSYVFGVVLFERILIDLLNFGRSVQLTNVDKNHNVGRTK